MANLQLQLLICEVDDETLHLISAVAMYCCLSFNCKKIYFLRPEKSHWIGQNFLIKLKLSNCDKINVNFCKLMLYGNYREIQIPKSVNKLLFCQKLKKVGKFSLFCLLFKYSKMLQNLRKCLSQFFHRFYLCSCPFPELKGFQWLKTQMRLFFRVGGSLNYFFRLCTKSLCEKTFVPFAFVTSFFNSCPPSSIWDFWPRKTYQQTIRPRAKKTVKLKISKNFETVSEAVS